MKLYLFAIVLMLASFFLGPIGVEAGSLTPRACTTAAECNSGEMCIGNKCVTDGFPIIGWKAVWHMDTKTQ